MKNSKVMFVIFSCFTICPEKWKNTIVYGKINIRVYRETHQPATQYT